MNFNVIRHTIRLVGMAGYLCRGSSCTQVLTSRALVPAQVHGHRPCWGGSGSVFGITLMKYFETETSEHAF